MGENDQVGSAAVRMEWTPADERGAGTTKLDAIALDDVGNRMLLTDPLGIDAFSGGLSDGHHSACRRVRDDEDSRLLLCARAHME
jgi:hypothetical protein